jgi:EpsI family protein
MLARSLILFVCLTVAAGAIARAERSESVPPRTPLAAFPMHIGDWDGVQEPPFEANILKVLGVDEYLTRAYFLPNRDGVGLYIGYYRSQRQGDTMHSPLNCLPGSGWEPVSQTYARVPLAGAAAGGAPSTITINRYVVQKGLDRQLVLYWYQAHGRVVASEYWSKFYLIRDAVRLNRTDGALVRVIAPILGDGPDAEARAERLGTTFVQTMFPHLAAYLPQ